MMYKGDSQLIGKSSWTQVDSSSLRPVNAENRQVVMILVSFVVMEVSSSGGLLDGWVMVDGCRCMTPVVMGS